MDYKQAMKEATKDIDKAVLVCKRGLLSVQETMDRIGTIVRMYVTYCDTESVDDAIDIENRLYRHAFIEMHKVVSAKIRFRT